MDSSRQSNIELCRFASIVLGYCFLESVVVEAFTIIGVNVFGLITGYFSTEPKKNSLIMAFLCFFGGDARKSCG